MTSDTRSFFTSALRRFDHIFGTTHKAARMAAVVACISAHHFAQAADVLYAHDSFDYAVGSALATQSGGSGWADPWTSLAGTNGATVVTGLEYTDAAGKTLTTSGGAIRTNPSTFYAQEKRSTLKQFGQAGDSVWVSFLVQQVPNPKEGTSYAVVALGQDLSFDSSAMNGGIAGTNPFVGAFYSGTESQSSTTTVAENSVSFITLRYDFAPSGNDTVSLWINPLLDSPLGAPDASGSFRDYSTLFSGVTLAYGDNKSFIYDELRIGSSYSAVSGVPEPQSLVLLLAGLGMFAVFKRRMR